MKKIYTSVDLGSDTIKIVTAEIYKNRCNVLASTSLKCEGIKNGLIVDGAKAIVSVKEAIASIERILSIKIKNVIASVPCNNAEFSLVDGYINITNEDGLVTGNDVIKCLKACVYNKIDETHELITTNPIEFSIDGETGIKDPKGIKCERLGVKAIMITTPKKNVYSVISLLEAVGLKVIDITFNSIGDYYEIRNKEMDSTVSGIINIGSDTTTVSVFNKGILMNTKVLNIGSKNIDKDITYVYKLNLRDSQKLKENFAIAHKRFAQVNETFDIINNVGDKLKINQYEVSEICMDRLIEILKIAKNEIKDLTNKEISYIIITGGASEFSGFNTLLNEFSSRNIAIADVNTIGVRKNRFSSSLGMIKYFNKKSEFRGREYSMFDEEQINELVSTKKKSNLSNDSFVGKVFGYFFDN
ncbi:MAG: cell division protein FtsA [Bacilli bacterium]|nr:cell division protein FtsA [Bacilli bacterium]